MYAFEAQCIRWAQLDETRICSVEMTKHLCKMHVKVFAWIQLAPLCLLKWAFTINLIIFNMAVVPFCHIKPVLIFPPGYLHWKSPISAHALLFSGHNRPWVGKPLLYSPAVFFSKPLHAFTIACFASFVSLDRLGVNISPLLVYVMEKQIAYTKLLNVLKTWGDAQVIGYY